MTLNDYRVIVVGTDGSSLAGPTVARAAWLAHYGDSDLVIVCSYSDLSRRAEAKNVSTIGGDTRLGQVMGRAAATAAVAEAVRVAHEQGATIAATLLIEGDPAEALLATARERRADLLVVGAVQHVSVAERILGTVSSEIVRKADCEVLVVRPAVPSGEVEVPEDA